MRKVPFEGVTYKLYLQKPEEIFNKYADEAAA
jgi:hypothetical protein